MISIHIYIYINLAWFLAHNRNSIKTLCLQSAFHLLSKTTANTEGALKKKNKKQLIKIKANW